MKRFLKKTGMVGEYPKRFGICAVFLANCFLMGCSMNSQRQHILSAADVQMTFEVEQRNASANNLLLTLKNTSKHAGVLHLPELLNGADTKQNAQRRYFLVLKASRFGSEREEQFGWTCVTKIEPQIRQTTVLQPNEICTLTLSLGSFYMWGGPGPASKSYNDMFLYGTNKMQLKVILSQGEGQTAIESDAKTYEYSFPEWMFQASHYP